MDKETLLWLAIEKFWDSVPSVWGKVRNNIRGNAITDLNVTLIQFHILRHIRNGAHTVAELAERQQISRPAVSQALDLLVEKELVTRTTDQQDRRYVHLALTESGDRMLTTVFSKSRHWMADSMQDLSEEELQTIIKAMDILNHTFIVPNE